VAVDNKNTEE